MGLLGKPLGTFSLDESDRYIGSFISKADVERILFVNDDDMIGVPLRNSTVIYIDETTLRKSILREIKPNERNKWLPKELQNF